MSTTKKIAAGIGVVASIAVGTSFNVPVDTPKTVPIKKQTRAAVVKDGEVINVIILPEGWPNVENAWIVPKGASVIFDEKVDREDLVKNGVIKKRSVPTKPFVSATSTRHTE